MVSGKDAAATEQLEFSYNLTATSDYMYRGISQTLGKPALQGSISFEHDNGFFGSLWASNIDFVKDYDLDDGARTEINLDLGYSLALSDEVAVEFSVLRFIAPSTAEGIDYEFNEWFVALVFSDRHRVSTSYANDTWGSGAKSWHYLASTSWPLARNVSLDLEAGYYDLSRVYGESYEYGSVAFSHENDWSTLALAYHTTASRASALAYESTIDPRVVLTLDIYF